jgi:hypothetical protein
MGDDDEKPVVTLQLVGRTPPIPQQIEEYLVELVKTKKISEILYREKRNEIAAATGIAKGALDKDVDARIKAEKGDDDDDSADLYTIGKRESKELWHNSSKVAFATISRLGHLEHFKLDSQDYRDFLHEKFGELNKTVTKIETEDGEEEEQVEEPAPKRAAVDEAIYQLAARARNKRWHKEYSPRVRLNYDRGALWLDLGGPDWKCVRIDSQDWEIRNRCDAKVIRGTGAHGLPEPVRGGNIQDLRQFLNVQNDEAFVLCVGALMGAYNPFGNYVATFFCGPSGSAKTTAMRVTRRLIDPHEIDERPLGDVRDFLHGLTNTHVLAFENVSGISDRQSDEICRLCTGTGIAEREHFKQGAEWQTRAHCPVMVNGIPGRLAEKDDLIARSVTISFQHLGRNFKSDDAFWNHFNEARPELLGCVFDGLVGALRMRRDFQDDNDAIAKELLGYGDWPRFVDTVVFVEAACRAMGFPPGAYIEAFRNNQGSAIRWLADHHPICVGIKEMIAVRGRFRGSPEQLYQLIKPYVTKPEVEYRLDGKFPVNSSTMMRYELNRAITPLEKVYGIRVRTGLSNNNDNDIEIIGPVPKGTQFPRSEAAPERVETVEDLLRGTQETENLGTPTYPEPESPKPPTQPIIRRR